MKKDRIIGVIFGLFIVGLIAGGGYLYHRFDKLTKEYAILETDKETLEKNLTDKIAENTYILSKLEEEASKNSIFENQIKEIMGTVGVLDKLSKTDKELLQKYSKVYFLNEHFIPENLGEIKSDYIFEAGRKIAVHAKIMPFLENMLKSAEANNAPIRLVSGYRSFNEQSSLKSAYKVTYGSGANQFSADQGYSEHQLGTALDLTTVNLGANFTQFADTKAYEWLKENAYKYGFVLSYPEGNTYYQFEPWHWRFVGVKLATRLHNEGENFYDVDQRTIDNYLINIFD